MSNRPGTRQRTELPFRRAEWDLLVKLPGRVVVAATSAQPDDARRTVAEGLAGIDAIAAGRASASRLVRDIVAAIYDEPDDAELTDRPLDIAGVLADCRTAARLLTERAGRLETDAYRHWLVAIATRVCHASRAGGLLGIGGAAVGPGERRFLADLEVALSGQPLELVEDGEVGVGPWVGPWPDDPRYDPALLAGGDRRNVVDRYRYWRREAVVADLDARRHDFHVAIENWQHDLNIGTVVRNANAFLAAEVHIVGKRKWNRRGAMVTDRYQHIRHHETIEEFVAWARAAGLAVVGIDNLPGARLLERARLPRRCVLLFGQEGPGLSEAAREACHSVLFIAQFGSTRSINAGVASGIAMHEWIRQWTHFPDSLDGQPPGGRT